MRMNQEERRFDFHGLGAALKRAREEKGWTQAYVAELVDRDSRTIMNIEMCIRDSHSISTLPILMARRSHCLRRLTACKAASTLGL